MTNINKELLVNQLEEFFDVSGSDISTISEYENSISFGHVVIGAREITIFFDGKIELGEMHSMLREQQDAKTIDELNEILEERSGGEMIGFKVISESHVENIQEIIAFIYKNSFTVTRNNV